MLMKLDVIIFAASGLTGQIVVEDAVEMLKDFKWGIAGRNMSKLQNVLKTMGEKLGKDLSSVPIIIADIEDPNSIKEMAKKCKVLLNCCGPYYFYGESVVMACIEAGTHHLDISGEPQYIGNLQLKYHDLAAEKGTYIVSTCGFDSIPAEMGVIYAERNFPGTVNSVEMFLDNSFDYKDKHSKALIHYGTWESIIFAMKHFMELISISWKLRPKNYPELKPKLKPWPCAFKDHFLDGYYLPIHAGDRDAVLHSQRLRCEEEKKRPIQFENYIGFKTLFWAIVVPIQLMLIFLLSQLTMTRKLLLQYPQFFTFGLVTHEGPTAANRKAQHFQLTFRTKGWIGNQNLCGPPKATLFTRISGYNGYDVTSVAFLAAGKMILNEKHRMPEKGGVFAPGYAFGKTSLIDELSNHKNGLKFEVLGLEQ